MSKASEILDRMGGALKDSAGHRPPPMAMPSASLKIGPVDGRMADLIRSKTAYDIPVAKIVVDPDQPRKTFGGEEHSQLVESIRHNGLLHPIGVRWMEGQGTYMVVYGERRFRATLELGSPVIACKVWPDGLTPEQVTTIQSCENLSRVDVRPIEQARAFRTLLTVNNLTQAELARQLGVSQTTIAMALPLLDLPEEVQDSVARGKLAASTAYKIASKVGDPEEQKELAARVMAEDLTRTQADEMVRERAAEGKSKGEKGRAGRPSSNPPGKPPGKPPTERTIRTSTGVKIVATARKGLPWAAVVQALEEATATARAKVEGDGEGGD
jgi:ParB family transcriptional regulator, chromosome partitioning protein